LQPLQCCDGPCHDKSIWGALCRASIQYTVSVVVKQNRSVTNWTGRPAPVASAILTVQSPPPQPSSNKTDLERYAEQPFSDYCGCFLCCCGCCVRGTVGIHVGADSNCVPTGGSIDAYSLIWVRAIPVSFVAGALIRVALCCINVLQTAVLALELHHPGSGSGCPAPQTVKGNLIWTVVSAEWHKCAGALHHVPDEEGSSDGRRRT
jgi:hypothetical protein